MDRRGDRGKRSIFAPARTPAAIIDKLHGEIVKAVQSPEMRRRLPDIGIDPATSTPKALSTYLAAQMKRMRAAVAMSGARRDQ